MAPVEDKQQREQFVWQEGHMLDARCIAVATVGSSPRNCPCCRLSSTGAIVPNYTIYPGDQGNCLIFGVDIGGSTFLR